MTDEQLLQKVATQFAEERSLSHSILLDLLEIRKRRLYAKRGFSSLFEMLVKHFRQSETAANQRLKALDLMIEVPVVEERLVSGGLNMSTLALAQRQIKREEKITGKRVSREKKERIVEVITNKILVRLSEFCFNSCRRPRLLRKIRRRKDESTSTARLYLAERRSEALKRPRVH